MKHRKDSLTTTEKPILFSGEMVQAILQGRKTQTRRVMRPQPTCPHDLKYLPWKYQPGMRLWVRETWQPCRNGDTGREVVVYKADWESHGNPSGPIGGHWRPSIHMPREASRITLEVTEVRVQRVQEITEEDAEAEGIDDAWLVRHHCGPPRRNEFRRLWDSLNEKRGYAWDKNPLVYAITFRRLQGDDDVTSGEPA